MRTFFMRFWIGLGIAPVLLVAACAEDRQEAGRCLHYYQGDFGNYTKWGPCPSNEPRPWEDAGR